MTQTLSTLGSDAPDASALSKAQLLDAYRMMRSIRASEDRVHKEFATGDIPGFVHLYAREEASATGVCAHLDQDHDFIASTHRGHGHCIAKGVEGGDVEHPLPPGEAERLAQGSGDVTDEDERGYRRRGQEPVLTGERDA